MLERPHGIFFLTKLGLFKNVEVYTLKQHQIKQRPKETQRISKENTKQELQKSSGNWRRSKELAERRSNGLEEDPESYRESWRLRDAQRANRESQGAKMRKRQRGKS